MDIAQNHTLCFESFQRLCGTMVTVGEHGGDCLVDVNDEFDRYRLWAGNVGAGSNIYDLSLDYRLRESSFWRDQVSSILKILLGRLDKATDLLEGTEAPFEQPGTLSESEPEDGMPGNTNASQESYVGEDSPSETSSDSDYENERPPSPVAPDGLGKSLLKRPETEMGQVLKAIQKTVTALYRLPIRKPAPIDRLKNQTTSVPAYFQHSDTMYVRDKFKDLDEEVAQRLGKMITRRRQLLQYRKDHQEKLRAAANTKIPERKSEPPTQSISEEILVPEDKAAPTYSLFTGEAPSEHQSRYTKATTMRTEGLPRNSPSHLLAPSVADTQSEARTSVVGSESARALHVDVPPRPRNEQGHQLTRLKCEYCQTTQLIDSDRAWRKHVLADLQPYVCTFGSCDASDHFFKNRDAWYEHELRHHRVEFFCNVAGHLSYELRSDFEKHLQSEHGLYLEASPALLDPFRMPSRSVGGHCNLCFQPTSNVKTHVSRHLEQLAIFAIPREDFDTDEITEDTTKLALLIASPWGGLKGPINDARLMEQELRSRGFEIIQCYGDSATQRGILDAWVSLIAKLQEEKTEKNIENPAVLIYYSGYGGLVRPPKDQDESGRQYQFIVPSDFNQADDSFTGILDIEINHLLTRTTDETENVTVILDCCHSGRIARDPYHPKATPKAIPLISHQALRAHVEKLQETGQLQGETYLNGNPYAVRVAAAATAETAWEYEDEEGLLVGALTKALVAALQESPLQDVSWRTTLLRVCELVNLEFPHQHPHVEGPGTRFLFSTEVSGAESHTIQIQDGLPIIRAGRIAGVKEGNVYTVMPFGYEEPNDTNQLCRARVLRIDGVRSLVELFEQTAPIPSEGALAFLDTKALHRWTVAYSKDDETIHHILEHSKYLRPHSPDDREKPLIRIVQEDGALCAYDKEKTLLTSRPLSKVNHAIAAREVVKGAERYARGYHLLTLQGGSGPEAFLHNLRITTGLVKSGRAVELPSDGNAILTEGERIYIALHNRGHLMAYVSVFDVSPAGEICLISAQGETGIPIKPGQASRIGENTFSILTGLGISWPESIPRRGRLSETLVFIITSEPVDLRHLEDQGTGARGYDQDKSQLEFITHHLAVGGGRPVQPQRELAPVQYDVIRFPFSLDSVAQG